MADNVIPFLLAFHGLQTLLCVGGDDEAVTFSAFVFSQHFLGRLSVGTRNPQSHRLLHAYTFV